MKELVTLFLTLFEVFILTSCQRVAPGVPPQQYHPPPVPTQQYQQQIPQQHYQQVPVQQHQVPVQQYQQVPVQQPAHGMPPVQAQHHPHAQPQQILNAANIVHEKQHIQEHLEVPIDTSKMSDQELQFHYFKMHDADNNNKLDGCELIKSLIHWHAENEGGDKNDLRAQTDTELADMIDPILKTMDSNNDGYVDYAEFKQAEG